MAATNSPLSNNFSDISIVFLASPIIIGMIGVLLQMKPEASRTATFSRRFRIFYLNNSVRTFRQHGAGHDAAALAWLDHFPGNFAGWDIFDYLKEL